MRQLCQKIALVPETRARISDNAPLVYYLIVRHEAYCRGMLEERHQFMDERESNARLLGRLYLIRMTARVTVSQMVDRVKKHLRVLSNAVTCWPLLRLFHFDRLVPVCRRTTAESPLLILLVMGWTITVGPDEKLREFPKEPLRRDADV